MDLRNNIKTNAIISQKGARLIESEVYFLDSAIIGALFEKLLSPPFFLYLVILKANFKKVRCKSNYQESSADLCFTCPLPIVSFLIFVHPLLFFSLYFFSPFCTLFTACLAFNMIFTGFLPFNTPLNSW